MCWSRGRLQMLNAFKYASSPGGKQWPHSDNRRIGFQSFQRWTALPRYPLWGERLIIYIPMATWSAFALLIVINTIWMIIVAYRPIPVWDQWASIAEFKRLDTHGLDFMHLFAQHNEHRIALPRLIFSLDRYLAKATNLVDLLAIVLIQAAHSA